MKGGIYALHMKTDQDRSNHITVGEYQMWKALVVETIQILSEESALKYSELFFYREQTL